MQGVAKASVELRLERSAGVLLAAINEAYRCPSGTGRSWTGEGGLIVGDRITEAALERELNDPRVRVVAAFFAGKKNAAAVGSVKATLLESDNSVEIGMLNVDPLHQNLGLGRLLMEAAERAWGTDVASASLHVLARRSELIAWYERLGYCVVPNSRQSFPSGQGFGEPRPSALEEYGGELYFVEMRKTLGKK